MTQSLGDAQRTARRVIRIAELATTKKKKGRLPVSPATLWRWIKEGKFPQPFKLGPNTTVWDLDQIEAFVAQQAEVQA
jgi:prophage regulatory protein